MKRKKNAKPSRPLPYDSLKTVLLYMEANLRFKLSRQIPSISATEKLVPLKINKLKLCPYDFVVNDNKYSFGTYRVYPPGAKVPIEHLMQNFDGGAPNDLDQHGFDDYSSDRTITPGDLEIKGIRPEQGIRDDRMAGELVEELRFLDGISARREGQDVELDEHDEFFQEANTWSNIELKYQIEFTRMRLKPYECRRDNTPTEFFKMIQLTVFGPEDERKISRRSGDIKIYETHKKLLDILFGSRRTPIHVKRLEVDCQSVRRVIRLPQNFRLKVREIEINPEAFEVCEAIQPIIDGSSYPLKLFKTYRQATNQLNHPLMKSAEALLITCNTWRTNEPWLHEFQALTNKKVHLREDEFTSDEHVDLIKGWIDNRREVGTCFTFGLKDEATIKEIFAKIKGRLDGSDSGERALKIPTMSDSAEIHVSYIYTPYLNFRYMKWTLKIEVMDV